MFAPQLEGSVAQGVTETENKSESLWRTEAGLRVVSKLCHKLLNIRMVSPCALPLKLQRVWSFWEFALWFVSSTLHIRRQPSVPNCVVHVGSRLNLYSRKSISKAQVQQNTHARHTFPHIRKHTVRSVSLVHVRMCLYHVCVFKIH